ncbi:epimerase [Microbacterium sp. A1-JK]|uniref:epimerase n=1 Tax=Microbacterium sp. A1-JK TaxID=3177516 RepID=UPI0038840223
MTRRAVVAGGSGFVGTAVIASLRDEGYLVTQIGRRGPDASWGDSDGIRRTIDGADLLVNLAGKRVDCRYTDANRDEILRSRVETTRELREAVADVESPPAVWLNASTATIYRYALDRPQSEDAGDLGSGFSVDVARAWEQELFADDLPATRRVALRMAIVFGDGPATAMLLRLARLGLGGPQYDGPWFEHRRYRGIGERPTGDDRAPWHRSRGRQRFSWIHLDDVVGSMRFLRETPSLSGPINLSAPNPTDNRGVMAALRRAVGAPVGIPAARFMLEPALWALGAESELLLKSRWVVPDRLVEAGYVFRYPELEPALRDVARR